MTQEDKELLFKELCMRLPYGVKFHYTKNPLIYMDQDSDGTAIGYYCNLIATKDIDLCLDDCKLYLRSMSSMTEEEVKELLFVRLASKYGESCAYIKNFIKLNEVSFRQEYPYKGTIDVWFSFQIIEYSKCEHLGRINDITLAEIDWLNAHHFDYRGLIPKGLAIAITKENNHYKY